jgi:RNase P/RNase MRP subunit p29
MDDETIVKEELIGRNVTIKDCTDPTWDNKTGIILDETKNTFIIEINDNQKKIAKNIASFEFNEKKSS